MGQNISGKEGAQKQGGCSSQSFADPTFGVRKNGMNVSPVRSSSFYIYGRDEHFRISCSSYSTETTARNKNSMTRLRKLSCFRKRMYAIMPKE